jgi:hypothetical protein
MAGQIDATRVFRGWKKRACARMLVDGVLTHAQIAKHFDTTREAVSLFKKRNAVYIEEMQQKRDDELAGLWIADKLKRVAEYERDVEDINDVHDQEGAELDSLLLTRKHAALRNVAEELGQLKETVRVETATYQVEGVDMGALE